MSYALTLTQPWATLVALGEKQIETRSWGTNYRGPLMIHAAKQLPMVWRQFGDEHFVNALESVCGLNEFGVPNLRELPTGCVLAVAQLVDSVRMEPDISAPGYHVPGYIISDKEAAFGHWEPGRYAWILEEVMQVDPYPLRGRQRLWKPPLSAWAEIVYHA